MIYRILFARPTAIVPGPNRYKCSNGWCDKPVVPIYSYQWNDRRQNGHEGWGLPKYDSSYGGLQIAWSTKPSTEQARCIEAGTFSTNSMKSEQNLPGTTYNEARRRSPSLHLSPGNIHSSSYLQSCGKDRRHPVNCAHGHL